MDHCRLGSDICDYYGRINSFNLIVSSVICSVITESKQLIDLFFPLGEETTSMNFSSLVRQQQPRYRLIALFKLLFPFEHFNNEYGYAGSKITKRVKDLCLKGDITTLLMLSSHLGITPDPKWSRLKLCQEIRTVVSNLLLGDPKIAEYIILYDRAGIRTREQYPPFYYYWWNEIEKATELLKYNQDPDTLEYYEDSSKTRYMRELNLLIGRMLLERAVEWDRTEVTEPNTTYMLRIEECNRLVCPVCEPNYYLAFIQTFIDGYFFTMFSFRFEGYADNYPVAVDNGGYSCWDHISREMIELSEEFNEIEGDNMEEMAKNILEWSDHEAKLRVMVHDLPDYIEFWDHNIPIGYEPPTTELANLLQKRKD